MICVPWERTYPLVRRLCSLPRKIIQLLDPMTNGIHVDCRFIPHPSPPHRCVGEGVVSRGNGSRHGFSLMEALVAITIMAIAGSALLWGVAGAMQTTDDSLQQALAVGMAQQLMDEIIGNRYHDERTSDGYQYPMAASWDENQGQGRERYNDIDDYNGLRFSPPVEVYGTEIGMGDGSGDLRHPNFRVAQDYFLNWRQEIDVSYVRPDDFTQAMPSGSRSDYRAVEVRIVRDDPDSDPRVLAELRQVVSYVRPL